MHDQVHACTHHALRLEAAVEAAELSDPPLAAVEIDAEQAVERQHGSYRGEKAASTDEVRYGAVAEQIDDHQIEAVATLVALLQIAHRIRLYNGDPEPVDAEMLPGDRQHQRV